MAGGRSRISTSLLFATSCWAAGCGSGEAWEDGNERPTAAVPEEGGTYEGEMFSQAQIRENLLLLPVLYTITDPEDGTVYSVRNYLMPGKSEGEEHAIAVVSLGDRLANIWEWQRAMALRRRQLEERGARVEAAMKAWFNAMEARRAEDLDTKLRIKWGAMKEYEAGIARLVQEMEAIEYTLKTADKLEAEERTKRENRLAHHAGLLREWIPAYERLRGEVVTLLHLRRQRDQEAPRGPALPLPPDSAPEKSAP